MTHAATTKLYTEMYEEYYPRLLRSIPKLTFDFEEREDIAQETFARVWDALQKDQFDGRSDPFTWIFKVAIGASHRHLTNKQRAIPPFYADVGELMEYDPPEENGFDDDPEVFTMDPQELDEMGLVDYNTPEAVLSREQQEQVVDDSVDDLPLHYREIMSMYYYDGLTYEEIATEMEIPVETVRTRLRRARDRLKSFLGEEREARSEGGKT